MTSPSSLQVIECDKGKNLVKREVHRTSHIGRCSIVRYLAASILEGPCEDLEKWTSFYGDCGVKVASLTVNQQEWDRYPPAAPNIPG